MTPAWPACSSTTSHNAAVVGRLDVAADEVIDAAGRSVIGTCSRLGARIEFGGVRVYVPGDRLRDVNCAVSRDVADCTPNSEPQIWS